MTQKICHLQLFLYTVFAKNYLEESKHCSSKNIGLPQNYLLKNYV